jgi:hypothetical protein
MSRENGYGEKHTVRKDVNEILSYFLHLSPDSYKICYRRCPHEGIE